MFEINENMFLGTGDLKAYGGSKHGQVLRQIELSDWHSQSFGGEYSFLRLQKFIEINGRKGKLLHVILVPNGESFEDSEHYELIKSDAEKAIQVTNNKLIQ